MLRRKVASRRSAPIWQQKGKKSERFRVRGRQGRLLELARDASTQIIFWRGICPQLTQMNADGEREKRKLGKQKAEIIFRCWGGGARDYLSGGSICIKLVGFKDHGKAKAKFLPSAPPFLKMSLSGAFCQTSAVSSQSVNRGTVLTVLPTVS